jgi:hypothetical protein
VAVFLDGESTKIVEHRVPVQALVPEIAAITADCPGERFGSLRRGCEGWLPPFRRSGSDARQRRGLRTGLVAVQLLLVLRRTLAQN